MKIDVWTFVLLMVFAFWFIETRTVTDGPSRIVHKLEEGGWVQLDQAVAILVAAVDLRHQPLVFQGGSGFKGLAHEKAIEQAQIAREIARGNGFSTKMIRPAAIWQFERTMGALPARKHAGHLSRAAESVDQLARFHAGSANKPMSSLTPKAISAYTYERR